MAQGRRILLLSALAVLVAGSGCSGKREHAEERTQTEIPRTDRPAPPEPSHDTAAVVDSAGSIDELFSRIHDHESKLSQIISANRFDEVGREAFLIRDLTLRAAGLANASTKTSLEPHVAAVKQVAADLSAAAKAGDLSEIKARNAEFQKELGVIERTIAEAR